jgi:2-polyprenyl-3-methyl-5-hydroxy-6-metoxy-1,4-benzoquinol methylase
MEKINKCDLCEKGEFKLLFKNYDRMHGIEGNFNLVRCKSCGLVFVNPQPNRKEMLRYYPQKEYYSLKKNPVEDLKLKLYEIFYNKNNFLKKIILTPLRFMIRSTIITPGNFLDIGCGDGKFLRLMNRLGMKCWGIEPYGVSNVNEKNFKILNCDLKKAKFKEKFFDVITLNHVFEHVEAPSLMLDEIYRILNKNGKVIIATPNIGSFTAKIFGNKWFQLDTPRHLFLYSEETLKKYARKEGFVIKKIIYNSTPLQFSASLVYLLNEFRQKKVLLNKSSIPTNKILTLLLLPLASLFNFLRIGDQVEIVLEKSKKPLEAKL